MKRILSVLLAAMMLLGMTACGEPKETTKTPVSSVPDETVSESEVPVPTPTPTPVKGNRLLDLVKECKNVVYSVPQTTPYLKYTEPFAMTMAKSFTNFVKTNLNVELKMYPSDTEEKVEGNTVYFGQLRATPKEFYKDLAAADYYVGEKDGNVFVTGGSDYALQQAIKDMKAGLKEENFKFPMTYAAPEDKEVLKLRVATFNIQNGAGFSHRFETLAKFIVRQGVDIVGLQEVDINTDRNKHHETLKELAEFTGMKYYKFAKTIPLQGGEYGTGILSKYPIESFEVVPLETRGYEARTYGKAVINVNGTKVNMINTHLSWDDSFTLQREQEKIVGDVFMKLENAIFTADVNDHEVKGYSKYFPGCNFANGIVKEFNSCPGWGPFDNVITSPNSVALNRVMVEKPVLSDHFMVWMDFVFTKGIPVVEPDPDLKPDVTPDPTPDTSPDVDPNAKRLRAGTYSIQAGTRVSFDFSKIAEDIKKANLDVVGLQFVDMNTSRNHNQDTLKAIAEHCDLKYYKFFKTVDTGGGEFGNAIMSKYPIESTSAVEVVKYGETRILGTAVINMNGMKINVMTTQLSWDSSYASQKKQLEFVAEEYKKLEGPTVLAINMNAPLNEDCKKLFPDHLLANGQDEDFDSCIGFGAFDNVVVTPGPKAVGRGMLKEESHSDHYLVWIDVVFEEK